MSQAIWKYTIRFGGSLEIPKGAKLLSAKMQNDDICIWAVVDPKELPVTRKFEVYGTGHSINDIGDLTFINTVMNEDHSLVLHVFERNLAR